MRRKDLIHKSFFLCVIMELHCDGGLHMASPNKFCPSCGYESPAVSRFCENCGYAFPAETIPAENIPAQLTPAQEEVIKKEPEIHKEPEIKKEPAPAMQPGPAPVNMVRPVMQPGPAPVNMGGPMMQPGQILPVSLPRVTTPYMEYKEPPQVNPYINGVFQGGPGINMPPQGNPYMNGAFQGTPNPYIPEPGAVPYGAPPAPKPKPHKVLLTVIFALMALITAGAVMAILAILN